MAADSPKPFEHVVLSHPGCGPFVQHTARAMHEAGLLRTYATTFSYQPTKPMSRALRAALKLKFPDPDKQLRRRQITEVPDDRVANHPLPEIIRMAAVKFVGDPVQSDRVWDVTEQWFDRTVAARHTDGRGAIYGYEYACLAAFQAQRRKGGVCLYEMPMSHHLTTEELLGPEYERVPETLTPYEAHRLRLAPLRNERKDAELRLADHVFCNSTFTKESLLRVGVPEERITMIPLGAPPVSAAEPRRKDGPFIFLSAGNQTVRKGVHFLLEAWRKLAPRSGAELWLIGEMQLPERLLANLPGKVVIRPPVPRGELFEIYQQAGALVFPSLCEGFGMVITEAMAQGLPVITTPNTAGRDLIHSRENGLLTPVGDVDALAEAMEWCLDHPEEMWEIGLQARRTAGRWGWDEYRAAFGAAIQRLSRGEQPQPLVTVSRS